MPNESQMNDEKSPGGAAPTQVGGPTEVGQRLSEREKMPRSTKIIIAVIAVVFLFIFYILLDANKYSAQVKVVGGEGKVGVNPTTASLDFGDLSKGTSLTRTVALNNGTNISMYVMIFKMGDISDLIKINKNNFKLKGRTEEKIEFSMFVPASATVDKIYTGRIFIFKIPTF